MTFKVLFCAKRCHQLSSYVLMRHLDGAQQTQEGLFGGHWWTPLTPRFQHQVRWPPADQTWLRVHSFRYRHSCLPLLCHYFPNLLSRTSGEMPSILTQVKGGAYLSGLRSGDFLLTVNDIDVLYTSHEDIVELIKRSGLSLKLQCLENGSYFSSNSDDSDVDSGQHHHHIYNQVPHQTHRYRNKAPLRHRRTPLSNRSNSNENLLAPIMMSADYPTRADMIHPSNGIYTQPIYHPTSRPPSKLGVRRGPIGGYSAAKSNEPILDLLLEQKLSQIKCSLSESDSNNSCKTNSFNNNANGFRRNGKKPSNESNSEGEVLPKREPNGDGMKANPAMDNHLNVSLNWILFIFVLFWIIFF